MKILSLNKDADRKLKEASKILKKGGLVIYPTDTLYGLACNALDEKAILNVYDVKKRPLTKPLPIAVSSLEMMRRYAVVTEKAEVLAKHFLPGALTIILNKKGLPSALTANTDKVAIRIPNSKVALKLIELAGMPITATSANISGRPPPISAEEAAKQLRDVDVVLDGGRLSARIPSTIIDLTGAPKIIREGRIKRGEIEKIIKLA
jgi:L-threonylcarbamoyladenylate synthase